MAYGENIGQPWLHKGVKCAKCEVSPISGYRYKCKKRPDYDLCQACFRREIPDPKIKYTKIERGKTGPYQVHFIECAECGVAPIKGKRYRHKTQEDCDLCEACYSRATNPLNRRAQPESDYEEFEELVINSVCKKYNQVYHFDKRCDECLVSPICGPTFTSIKNPDYDLCAFCHDDKLQNDQIRFGDFVSRDKPDVNSVYHLNIICCVQCGATPIKGPAFKHRRDPNKTLCLICYCHVQEDKQRFFLRIEPPRQADKGITSKFASLGLKSADKATKTSSAPKASTENPPPPAPPPTPTPVVAAEPTTKSDPVPAQGANSTTSSDSNGGERGGVGSRGYGARTGLGANGTLPAPPGLQPSPKITNRTVVEIKTPPPPVYTAGLRTSRATQPPRDPSPRPVSPPSPPSAKQQPQSGMKYSASSPQLNRDPPPAQQGTPLKFNPSSAAPAPVQPKSILKVTFAEPEQQPPSSVKFSPAAPQPPAAQQADLGYASPPNSQQRPYPPSVAQNSIPQYQQRGFPQPAAPAAAPPGSNSSYQGGPGQQQPPSSQAQGPAPYPPPYPPPAHSMPGATSTYPPSAADYLAAMTAAQHNSAQQTIAMLNAIRIEKERSNLALMQQILRGNSQQGEVFSAMLGNTGGVAGGGTDYSALLNNAGGGGIDYSALLNNAGGGADYSAMLAAAAGGGGGMDFSSFLGGAAGGGPSVDFAAARLAAGSGQNNNLFSGVISNIGSNIGNLGGIG